MKTDTLICFDLDGTVTAQEILPELSKEIGLYEEIAALTRATIEGIIPFKSSFLLRCKLLKDIPIKKVHSIIDKIKLNEEIVDFINSHPQNCIVLTGNLDIWIKPLSGKIKCKFMSSHANEKKGVLGDVLSVIDKGDEISNLSCKKIVAVGDGMGDVGMFEQANVRIAFGKVHRPIKSLIKVSDYICFNEKTLCKLLNMQL